MAYRIIFLSLFVMLGLGIWSPNTSHAAFESKAKLLSAARALAFEFGTLNGIFKGCGVSDVANVAVAAVAPRSVGGFFANWFSRREIQSLLEHYSDISSRVGKQPCDKGLIEPYARQFQINSLNFFRVAEPFMKPP